MIKNKEQELILNQLQLIGDSTLTLISKGCRKPLKNLELNVTTVF